VQGKAIKVLGKAKTKIYYPDNFKTAIVQGTIKRKGTGRKVIVEWDGIDETCSVATRLLQRVKTVTAATDSFPTRATTAEASAAASATAVTEQTETAANDNDDEPESFTRDGPVEVNPAFDPAEAAAAVNPGENLLAPHKCEWKVAAGGVTVDVSDRARMGARMLWQDGLDNDRSPLQYFMWSYPMNHLGAGGTIEATNAMMDELGAKHMTVQEYFLYMGLMLLMSFYPKFTVDEMFSKSAACRKCGWLSLPLLSLYMSRSRFRTLSQSLSFITKSRAVLDYGRELPAFWQVQPLIDCFNFNRGLKFQPGWKLVADESVFP